MKKIYFHLVYRNYQIGQFMRVQNGESLLEPIFLLSIFQGLHILTLFNVYQNIFGRIKIENVIFWAISLIVFLAGVNWFIIRRIGFMRIKKMFLSQTKTQRKKMNIFSITYVFFTFFLFYITL